MLGDIAFRDGNKDDENFIVHSWIQSVRGNDTGVKGMPHRTLWEFQRRLVMGMLSRCMVRVAVNKKHPDHIVGYCVFEKVDTLLAVHFVFVKHIARRWGIGTALAKDACELMPASEIAVTQHSALGKRFWANLSEQGLPNQFNPFLKFKELHEPALSHLSRRRDAVGANA